MAKIDTNFRWDAYRFLIKPWRDSDVSGTLERFVGAIQQAWESTQGSIDAIGDLSDVDSIPDAFLTYLKWHVGWTKELDAITRDLTPDELRKLIGVSASMWKQKGTQRGLKSAIRFLTGAEIIIWNWFMFRWVAGVGNLWLTLTRGDSWAVGSDYGDADEYLSLAFIKDAAGLNRQLIRDIINLNRPANEVYQLLYVDFIDEFESGLGQWTQEGDEDATWSEDARQLALVPGSLVVAQIDDTSDWDQMYCMFQCQSPHIEAVLRLEIMRADADNCFFIKFSIEGGCELWSRTAGVDVLLTYTAAGDWNVDTKTALWTRVTWVSAVVQLIEVGYGNVTAVSYTTDAGAYKVNGGVVLRNDTAVEDGYTFTLDRFLAYRYPVRQDVVSGPGTISPAPAELGTALTRVYSEQFTSLGAWILEGYWHLSTFQFHTSPQGLYWGDGESGGVGSGTPGGYITGAGVLDETATSGSIDLSAFNSADHYAYVEFWQVMDTRADPFDQSALEILVDGSVVQTITKASIGSTTGVQRLALIPTVLGEADVKLRFRMDMVFANAGSPEQGWFIDNVSVLIARL